MTAESNDVSRRGHYWPEIPGVSPMVLNIFDVERRVLLPEEGMLSPVGWWSIDVFAAPLLIRVGDAHAPWIERPAGEVWMYPPQIAYWEDSTAHAGSIRSYWLMFMGGEAAGLRRFTNGPHGLARFRDPERRVSEQILKLAAAGAARGDASFWEAQAGLCEVISILSGAEQLTPGIFTLAPMRTQQTVLRQRVDEYLRTNLNKRVTLAGIAQHMKVSTSTLCHQYRQEAGDAPMRTLMKQRIRMARSLLVQGQPLKQIAEQTGFSSEFHLSKAFKQLEGVSPRSFLRRHTDG